VLFRSQAVNLERASQRDGTMHTYIMLKALPLLLIAYFGHGEPMCESGSYEEACPSGWIDQGSSGCIAPLSYTGPCATVLNIGEDAMSKEVVERECGVQWPCLLNEGGQDFARPCPLRWLHLGSFLCDPPLTQGGSCSVRVQADTLEKKKGSTDCLWQRRKVSSETKM